jgi:aspartate/methionine/tyrosine aminotransferase
MTGWRIGMAAGNATIIDALMRVKSASILASPGDPADSVAALDGP